MIKHLILAVVLVVGYSFAFWAGGYTAKCPACPPCDPCPEVRCPAEDTWVNIGVGMMKFEAGEFDTPQPYFFYKEEVEKMQEDYNNLLKEYMEELEKEFSKQRGSAL